MQYSIDAPVYDIILLQGLFISRNFPSSQKLTLFPNYCWYLKFDQKIMFIVIYNNERRCFSSTFTGCRGFPFCAWLIVCIPISNMRQKLRGHVYAWIGSRVAVLHTHGLHTFKPSLLNLHLSDLKKASKGLTARKATL